MKKTLFRLLMFFLILCPFNTLHADHVLTLGVHPYLQASEILEKFSPLADYLGRQFGHTIDIRISKDYKEHINRIGRNDVDIAYMGPASYVSLVDRYGKKPILARLEVKGFPTFQGMIVAAKNSPVKTLEDLAGKRMAFGDPNSTMSHLVPRYVLRQSGVDITRLSKHAFINNHHNVALGVLMGDYDAGAVKEETYYHYKDRGLRVLASTPRISEHLFVTSTSLNNETVSQLREILVGLKETGEGRKILSSIKGSVTGMVPAVDGDYENLRVILKTLAQEGITP